MKLSFHHIGVACRDLDSETRRFASLGYSAESPDFTDPLQGVTGRFLNGGGPRMELLKPLPGSGILTPWLRSGVKLYHLAYETQNITNMIEDYREDGAKLIVSPVPAVAFSGRLIAFLMLPNMLLIELIQNEIPNES